MASGHTENVSDTVQKIIIEYGKDPNVWEVDTNRTKTPKK